MQDAARASLSRCVGDVDAFFDEVFTQRAHLKERDGGDDFSDLLSIEHVDEILTTRSLRAPAFRLVRGGSTLPRSAYTRGGTVGGQRLNDLPDVGRVFAHFEDGATIVLQGLHRYWEPVSRFCRDLEQVLTHPVQANAYITPPVAAGLNVHHDTHDVFALQTYGRKQWVIHDPVLEQPLAFQGWSSDEHDAGEPAMDLELAPGDCLYVPRGTPHAARTVDRPSVHLTVGIRARTWHDVFRQVVDAAADEVEFREALPAGFAHDPDALADALRARLKDMSAFVEAQDPAVLARDTAGGFWGSRRPLLRGQLLDLLALSKLDDETVVEPRPGTVSHVELGDDADESSDSDRFDLVLGDRRVSMPQAARPAVLRLVAHGQTRIGDLADVLDANSRAVVARRLVREGVLRIARTS